MSKYSDEDRKRIQEYFRKVQAEDNEIDCLLDLTDEDSDWLNQARLLRRTKKQAQGTILRQRTTVNA
jgi:hypothetical protein